MTRDLSKPAAAPRSAPASPPAPTGDAGAPPSSCVWLWTCDRPAVTHGLCGYHALRNLDLIHEHERGDLEDAPC